MGRRPCCSKEGLNKGAWTATEDKVLTEYIQIHGEGKWTDLPQKAGLKRCGKSCRLRWLNYLRPGIRRGSISEEEEDLIIRLHKLLGNRWALIAGRLPGRTDNEIKNYWNTKLRKLKSNPQYCTTATAATSPDSSDDDHPNQLSAEKPNLATKHHLCEPQLDPNHNNCEKSASSCVVRTMSTSCTKPVITMPRPSDQSDQTTSTTSGLKPLLPSSVMNSKESDDQLSDFFNMMDFENMDQYFLTDFFNTDWISELPMI